MLSPASAVSPIDGSTRVRVLPLQIVRRESTRGFGRYEPRVLKVLETIRRESCNGLRARDVVKMMCGSRRLTELRFREAFGHSILDEINLGPYCGDYKDSANPQQAAAQERHKKLKDFLSEMGW